MIAVLLFVLGLALMVFGADLLVRGASRLAVMLGVTPLIVGLTVVAFGTSAPEFAVSFKSAMIGQAGVAIGNVIGSNIFNILFILGLSAVVTPLVVASQLIRFDVPLMVAVSLLAWLMASDGRYGLLDGVILFGGLLGYIGCMIYISRRQGVAKIAPEVAELIGAPDPRSPLVRGLVYSGMVALGLVLLILGSNWLVDSAITFARWFEVSEVVIGLTIIAIGTSLPEVVTSIVASLKNERDIAVGNVVGSNLFNLMGVLGCAALVAGGDLPISSQVLWFDLPVMVAVAIVTLPIFFSYGIIRRWEGGLLLAYYFAYTLYLILDATGHAGLSPFRAAMLYFAIPLTVLTLTVVLINDLRRRRVLSRATALDE